MGIRSPARGLSAALPRLPPEPSAPPSPAFREAIRDAVVDDLAHRGWSVCTGLVAPETVTALAAEARELWDIGALRRAGIGTGTSFQIRDEVRGDSVRWLDPSALTPAQALWWDELEALRQAINRSLFLGLFEPEAHLAVYPPGSFYTPHLDRHRGCPERTVTVILYLEPDWTEDDGGALRLYIGSRNDPSDGAPARSPEDAVEHHDILPEAGKVAVFLSSDILHEVLATRRLRGSVTGWLRTRKK